MDEHDSTSFIRDLWRVFKFPWVRGDEIAYTFMGAFFGETEKPHKLISNLWWVYGLARDKPSREKFRDRKKTTYTQVVTVDAAGVTHRAITGGPDLKKPKSTPMPLVRVSLSFFSTTELMPATASFRTIWTTTNSVRFRFPLGKT